MGKYSVKNDVHKEVGIPKSEDTSSSSSGGDEDDDVWSDGNDENGILLESSMKIKSKEKIVRYINDRRKRGQWFYRRKKRLLKYGELLHIVTGARVSIQLESESRRKYQYQSFGRRHVGAQTKRRENKEIKNKCDETPDSSSCSSGGKTGTKRKQKNGLRNSKKAKVSAETQSDEKSATESNDTKNVKGANSEDLFFGSIAQEVTSLPILQRSKLKIEILTLVNEHMKEHMLGSKT